MDTYVPEFEAEYAELFSSVMGAPAKTFRMALGALIIKEKLGISDRETVEQIKENPYPLNTSGKELFNPHSAPSTGTIGNYRDKKAKLV